MPSLDNWITGLMRENYEALSIIPDTTIRDRYIPKNRYIIQYDERGRKTGYILHGALHYGRPVVISQHCIQYEKRLHGYGEQAFLEMLRRANLAGASSIQLAVADDLPAIEFWRACGFQVVGIEPGGKSRNRMRVKMAYPLALPLFQNISEAA